MVFGLKLALLSKAPQVQSTNEEKIPASENIKALAAANHEGDQDTNAKVAKNTLTVNEFVARTKRCREKGLEPTRPELVAYARYLGIDPVNDGDLMWIVDESLNAPLPPEWTEHHDNAGRVFYYNVLTHQSSWTHPLEQLHRDTYKRIVDFRSGSLSKDEQIAELDRLRRESEQAESEAHKELQAWTEHVDENGQKFYNCREQQRSYWTDPRPARCHTLYLQMKALRVLAKHCGQGSSNLGSKLTTPSKPTLVLPRSNGDELRMGSGGADVLAPHGGRQRISSEDRGARSDSEGLPGANSGVKQRRRKHRGSEDHQEETGKSPDPWPLQRPNRRDVEEVRAALGIAQGQGSLPSLPSLQTPGRLLTPPNDGLSSVGRARVRAGIRLEPLKG